MRMPGFAGAGGGETKASDAAMFRQRTTRAWNGQIASPTNAIAACNTGSFFQRLWGGFGFDR